MDRELLLLGWSNFGALEKGKEGRKGREQRDVVDSMTQAGVKL